MYVEKTFDLSSKVEKGSFDVWFHVIGNLASLNVLLATIKAFPIGMAYAILTVNVKTVCHEKFFVAFIFKQETALAMDPIRFKLI